MSTETEITSSLGEPKLRLVQPKTQALPNAAESNQDLMPREWQEQQSNWLMSIMRAAMGDLTIPGIPNFDRVHILTCPSPEKASIPLPSRAYAIRYDLRLWAPDGDDPVLEFRNSLAQLFQKIKEIDKEAIRYPWTEIARQNKVPFIDTSGAIPIILSDLNIYVHRDRDNIISW